MAECSRLSRACHPRGILQNAACVPAALTRAAYCRTLHGLPFPGNLLLFQSHIFAVLPSSHFRSACSSYFSPHVRSARYASQPRSALQKSDPEKQFPNRFKTAVRDLMLSQKSVQLYFLSYRKKPSPDAIPSFPSSIYFFSIFSIPLKL